MSSNFRLVEIDNQAVETLLGKAVQAISGSLKRSDGDQKPASTRLRMSAELPS
jgi:hypothetical protein